MRRFPVQLGSNQFGDTGEIKRLLCRVKESEAANLCHF